MWAYEGYRVGSEAGFARICVSSHRCSRADVGNLHPGVVNEVSLQKHNLSGNLLDNSTSPTTLWHAWHTYQRLLERSSQIAKGKKFMDWPPDLPDLNSIEHCWFPLKGNVYITFPELLGLRGVRSKIEK